MLFERAGQYTQPTRAGPIETALAFRIRQAEKKDLSKIIKLKSELFKFESHIDHLLSKEKKSRMFDNIYNKLSFFQKDFVFLIAETSKGEIIGFVSGWIEKTPPIFKIRKKGAVKISKDDLPRPEKVKLPYRMKPGEYLLGETMETFDVPESICFLHKGNSVTVGLGLDVKLGFADPGYKGKFFYGIENVGENTILLERGTPMTKAIIMSVEGKSVPLITKFMGGLME